MDIFVLPTSDIALGRALGEIVLEAGRVTLDVYGSDFAVRTKQDRSPATEADRRAEDIILAGLDRCFPGIPVLAEEAAGNGPLPELADEFFLVDPLDGTREFISRNGEFTVNLALVQNHRPVAGVVLAPATGELFVALQGCGTKMVAAPQSACDLAVLATAEPITSGQSDPRRLRAIASRSHRDSETTNFLTNMKVHETISAGSSLKFCRLAQGLADVYPRFGRTMEWDTAAGQAVLECAGGAVFTLDGASLIYNKRQEDHANPAFIAWRCWSPDLAAVSDIPQADIVDRPA